MSGLQVIRPGDTVFVRLPERPSPEVHEQVVAKLKEMLPGCKVAILSGVDGLDVYRPDPEDT